MTVTHADVTRYFMTIPEAVRLVLLADLVYMLLLAALVLRRVATLVAARRAKSAGSRLHLRLTGAFALMALLPTITVAVFAVLTINIGLETWFSERVRNVVGASLSAAEAYEEEHREGLTLDARALAAFLDANRRATFIMDDGEYRGLITPRQLLSGSVDPDAKADGYVWHVARVRRLDDVRTVAARMVGSVTRVLPVFEGDELVGLVTAEGILEAVQPFLGVLSVRDVFTEDRHEELTPEVRALIAHLMLHHIIRTDRPLREFFRARGTQPETGGRLRWLDSFALGVEQLDADHRAFIDLLNQVEDVLRSGEPGALVPVIDQFTTHARRHFIREEAVLDSLGCPHADEHKHEHTILNRELFALAEELRLDPAAFGPEDLAALVKDWVIRHILFVDMKMKSHLQELLREHPDHPPV